MAARVYSFKADERLMEEVRRAAEQRGLTLSEAIRAALRCWLNRCLRPCRPYVSRRWVISDC